MCVKTHILTKTLYIIYKKHSIIFLIIYLKIDLFLLIIYLKIMYSKVGGYKSMKKNLKLSHFIMVYPSLWLLYCLFEIIAGKISTPYEIFMNLIPAFLLILISLLFFWYYKKSIILKKFSISVIIFALFLVDQFSKIIVATVFKKNNLTSLSVIKNYFSITPYINDQGSFIASRFDINAPFILFTILNCLILVLIFFVYRFKLQKKQINSIEQLTFIFLFSGGLCSLIDKLFWGGSLDFLQIHNLFIADIKDIFITFGLGSFVLCNLTSDDQIDLKEFFNFIFKSQK